MYPQVLEAEKGSEYFFDEPYFVGGKFKFIHSYLHKSYKFKMHSHQFYEINIIMQGSGRHYIDDTSLPAEVGDVFVIPPDIRHGYYSEQDIDIYHLLIKSDFFTRYGEELEQIKGFSILFDIEPYIRRFSGKSYNLNIGRDLVRLSEELDAIKRAEENGNCVKQNALTLALICRLCEKITKVVNSTKESTEIIKIMEFIKENISKKLTLDEIAACGNMSKATINRYFKTLLGVSPMNYVLQCRIARAKELLLVGEHSKTEIAGMCGFYDTAHMNKYI
jgi:AraC family L-rhamnose operon regulatory protein RhaS